MNYIRTTLEGMARGHVRAIHGVLVLRRGDNYVVGGDSVNIRDNGISLDDAAVAVFTTAGGKQYTVDGGRLVTV